MFKSYHWRAFSNMLRRNSLRYLCDKIRETACKPVLGYRADVGVDQFDILIPRKPEVHEPLPIQQPSHLLQNLNPAPIVLYQVIECANNGSDNSLFLDRRQAQFEGLCSGDVEVLLRCTN